MPLVVDFHAHFVAPEVMEFAYMSAPEQPREIAQARAALNLARGEGA